MTDHLTVSFEFPLPLVDAEHPCLGYSLFFYLNINGVDAFVTLGLATWYPLPVHYPGLRHSMVASGLHHIFVCVCGDPCCDSAWVETVIEADGVRWKALYDHDAQGQPGRRIKACDVFFAQAGYGQVLVDLEEIARLYTAKLHPRKVYAPRGLYSDLLTQHDLSP